MRMHQSAKPDVFSPTEHACVTGIQTEAWIETTPSPLPVPALKRCYADFSQHPSVLSVFALYINGIIQHVLFCIWLLWPSILQIYFYL